MADVRLHIPSFDSFNLAAAEKILILAALEHAPTATAAAKLLGIGRATMYRKLALYERQSARAAPKKAKPDTRTAHELTTRICERDGCPWGGKAIPLFEIAKRFRKVPQTELTTCRKCVTAKERERTATKRTGAKRCPDCGGNSQFFIGKRCATCGGTGWIQKQAVSVQDG